MLSLVLSSGPVLAVYLVLGTPPAGPVMETGLPPAHQAVPSTDIWVFPLESMGAGADPTSGIRATERPGYDNQPHFLPGSTILYYTSIDEAGQADIRSFHLVTGVSARITQTAPESEYSATVMPSGTRFSAIRVEADSAQRLWSFDLSGGTPAVVLEDIRPVGYHAWLDEDRLALFVLGSPATLQIASVSTGTARIAARDIGRSIYRAPEDETVSFVQWSEGGEGWITSYDPATDTTRPLAPLLEGNEYYAWTPDGVLLMGVGSRLYRWLPGRADEWTEVIDLGPAGIEGISRIAVSPDGAWIAVVAREG